MRISERLQQTLGRIEQINERIQQLTAQPPSFEQALNQVQAINPTSTGEIAPLGFPEGGMPPPGIEIRGDWDSLVMPVAQKYGLAAELLRGVIQAESGGNPNALSEKGAMGLMQLMPATAQAMGVIDPFDPAQNLEGGARYLKSLIDTFGNVRLALAAYNAGPNAVRRYAGIPPYPETQAYVRRILSTLETP